jgi:transposase-like protein
MASENEPKTLTESVVYFTNPDNCLNYLAGRRWPNGVTCPTCGSKNVGFVASRRIWQCNTRHDRAQFTIKTGTILEDSPLSLDKWIPALWMIGNDKNGISSWELHRALGVTQKTAWFMLHRIRLAMQDDNTGGKLGGEVEVDETFIGGKARNMHKDKKARVITGTGGKDKEIAMGMVERGGKVRVFHVDNRRRKALHTNIREHVEAGAAMFTDELKSYDGLESEYQHAVINHAVEYANGNVHTNTMENFWRSPEARPARNLHQCRAVSPVPVPRRAGVPLQQPEGHERCGPVQCPCVSDCWKTAHVHQPDW